MFAEVVLSNASPKLDKIFHYSIPQELESLLVVGSQIEIPFGKANRIGYVVGFVEKSSVPGIKPISKIVSDTPAFTKNGLELAKWLSDYYLSFFSTSLRAILPPGVNKRNVRTRTKKQKIESKNPAQQILPTNTIIDHTLTPSQQLAIDSLSESINNPEGEVFLLYGPAGSGKSEIYLKVVEEALNKGHGAIILTPEIGLTQSLIKRFKERFGEKIAVMHSGQKDAERTLEWEEIAQGKKQIVLGTRLAIFAPVKNLKVIILDEEYETTYKQEQNPRYQTRTVAEFMSKNFGITAIFGSAT